MSPVSFKVTHAMPWSLPPAHPCPGHRHTLCRKGTGSLLSCREWETVLAPDSHSPSFSLPYIECGKCTKERKDWERKLHSFWSPVCWNLSGLGSLSRESLGRIYFVSRENARGLPPPVTISPYLQNNPGCDGKSVFCNKQADTELLRVGAVLGKFLRGKNCWCSQSPLDALELLCLLVSSSPHRMWVTAPQDMGLKNSSPWGDTVLPIGRLSSVPYVINKNKSIFPKTRISDKLKWRWGRGRGKRAVPKPDIKSGREESTFELASLHWGRRKATPLELSKAPAKTGQGFPFPGSAQRMHPPHSACAALTGWTNRSGPPKGQGPGCWQQVALEGRQIKAQEHQVHLGWETK